jgi:hypothetical protein
MNDPKHQQGKQDQYNQHQKQGHNPNDPQNQQKDPKHQQDKGHKESEREKEPTPTR